MIELKQKREKNKELNNKPRIIGIEILRMFLCFRIVLLHYYSSNNIYILKLKSHQYQVPCFFFISFYFLYPIISEVNSKKLILRLERLLIPYIIYPIFVWLINNLMFLIFNFNRFNRFLTLNELKTHLVVGKGIFGIGVLWFHFNLIILTLLFFISSFFLKKYFLSFFHIVVYFSYIIQYSGKNYNFFKQFRINILMSVGNLLETLPLAIVSFSLVSNNFIQWALKNKKMYIIFSCFSLYLTFNFNIFSDLIGNSSAGIKKLIISFLLFTNSFILSIQNINIKINSLFVFIRKITKYTQGIYCLHFLIQYYIKLKFDRNGTFIGCINLYIISYFISFIGFKISEKSKLKYLFI